MVRRVSFSSEVLRIDNVAQMYADTEKSLRFYYDSPGIEHRDTKFLGYSHDEVRQELQERLRELDGNAALEIMSALEASFRMDYQDRCDQRWKDDLSRHFRDLYKRNGSRVSLEADILKAWKQYSQSAKMLVSQTIGAFKYRHWLAHGKYWVPKLGQVYDFFSVYQLAQQMEVLLQQQS
jgi:hypothetical protein